MFPDRFFPTRFFNPRYWVKEGSSVELVYGPICFHAAKITHPGAQSAMVQHSGAQSAGLFHPGAKAAKTT